MAPLSPFNTARYFVDYVANGRQHTAMFRWDPSATTPPPQATIDLISDFLNALAAFFPSDTAVLTHRYGAAGSNLTFPVASAAPTWIGSGSANTTEAPAYLNFVGRTLGGRRSGLMLLGASSSPASEGNTLANYRIDTGEGINFDQAYTALTQIGLYGIDGQPTVWYTYANAGYHSYWQRKMRG